MVQSLDFVLHAKRDPDEMKNITKALSSSSACSIIVDRHKLTFDPERRFVTVDRASEDDPSACKIIKCRMPYTVLARLLEGNWDDLSGFEWLLD